MSLHSEMIQHQSSMTLAVHRMISGAATGDACGTLFYATRLQQNPSGRLTSFKSRHESDTWDLRILQSKARRSYM